MAARTRSSSIPRARSWRATIWSRSVDVVPERVGLMDEHLPATGRDHTVSFEPGQEAARRFARGAGKLSDLGLRRADRYAPLELLALGLVAARLDLPEQRAGDP